MPERKLYFYRINVSDCEGWHMEVCAIPAKKIEPDNDPEYYLLIGMAPWGEWTTKVLRSMVGRALEGGYIILEDRDDLRAFIALDTKYVSDIDRSIRLLDMYTTCLDNLLAAWRKEVKDVSENAGN